MFHKIYSTSPADFTEWGREVSKIELPMKRTSSTVRRDQRGWSVLGSDFRGARSRVDGKVSQHSRSYNDVSDKFDFVIHSRLRICHREESGDASTLKKRSASANRLVRAGGKSTKSCLQYSVVDGLGLPIIGRADDLGMIGEETTSADIVNAQIEWRGEVRYVEITVRNDFILGTQLLEDTRLIVDYPKRTHTISREEEGT